MKPEIPIYKSIALDIAQRIVNAELEEGTKVSGRSVLAGHYNVSPETIRRAIALLREEKVVSVSQGKEILIGAAEQAYQFIERHKNIESVYSLREELESLISRKHELDEHLERVMLDIINYSDRFRNLSPYNPVEIAVPKGSHVVGRSVNELQFWQHTGATIVAIRRDAQIIISPGPCMVIRPHDRIVVVGDGGVLERTGKFLGKMIGRAAVRQ